MGHFNYGYASIQEVWGEDLTTKKKKKKPQQDPMCDLYEMKGSSSAYTETEIVNTANEKRFRNKPPIKPQDEIFEEKNLPNSLFEKQFEVRHPQSFEMDDPSEYMIKSCKSYDDEPVDNKQHIVATRVEDERIPIHPKETYYHTEDELPVRKQKKVMPERHYDSDSDDEMYTRTSRRNNLVYLDIILYVLSGVILIFLLEQFVRIGINMQHV